MCLYFAVCVCVSRHLCLPFPAAGLRLYSSDSSLLQELVAIVTWALFAAAIAAIRCAVCVVAIVAIVAMFTLSLQRLFVPLLC